MSIKHSKKPWLLGTHGELSADGYEIGLVYGVGDTNLDCDEMIMESIAECHANGALIENAPDLLEKLEEVAPLICSFTCPSVWRIGQKPPHSPLCVSIHDLIRKARWEQ